MSIATLPFLDDLWAGELPVLALLQLPKIELAWWITNHIVYDLLRPMSWSSGSVSPDQIIVKPIGLAPAYVIPFGITYAVVGWRSRFGIAIGWRRSSRWPLPTTWHYAASQTGGG